MAGSLLLDLHQRWVVSLAIYTTRLTPHHLAGTTGLPKAAIVTHGRSATAFIVRWPFSFRVLLSCSRGATPLASFRLEPDIILLGADVDDSQPLRQEQSHLHPHASLPLDCCALGHWSLVELWSHRHHRPQVLGVDLLEGRQGARRQRDPVGCDLVGQDELRRVQS